MLERSRENASRWTSLGWLAAVALVTVGSYAPVARAAGDVAAGKIKAETCKGCHAVEGYKNSYPTYRVPKLRGQNVEYLIIALRAYRDGLRQHATMQSHGQSMSDQDIEDIAAYIGSLEQ